MAYISQDSTLEEDSPVPASFLTACADDPYLNAAVSVNYPNAKRNILSDINNAELTMLPVPQGEKECLKVYLRVKPKTDHEMAVFREMQEDPEAIMEEVATVESEHQIALQAPKESKAYKNSINGVGKMVHRYTFTQIFRPEVGQREIFRSVVLPRVRDFLGGQNQLLFTYGATSAGKTYTIQGTPDDPGLMPLALDTLFGTIGAKISDSVPVKPSGFNGVEAINSAEMARLRQEKESVFRLGLELFKNRKPEGSLAGSQCSIASTCSQASSTVSSITSTMSNSETLDLSKLEQLFSTILTRVRGSEKVSLLDEGIHYTVWISFVEIYNENIYDLFQRIPEVKKKGETVRRKVLKLCEDRNGSAYVKDLREIQVMSADEAYQALMIGRENLQFAATKLNTNSSRSHCIFTLKVIRVADTNVPHLARVSLLSFCDLAGSERISKTRNVGERQKEAGNINGSLLVLGRCISAIRHNQQLEDVKKHQVVPFREAKLTRLIKTFFSGLGKASLVVCVSQAPYLFDESVHVLKFASIASRVTVQQFKEPRALPPSRKTTSRFSSMLAGGGKSSLLTSMLSGRGSIAWEEPRSRSTMLPDFTTAKGSGSAVMVNGRPVPVGLAAKRSTASAAANLSGVEEEGEESTEQDVTVVEPEQYHILLNLVEDLKQKLLKERQKNITLEANIREELVTEFNKMMVEVERDWEDRLEKARENVRDHAEWRINALQQAYQSRNHKRRRQEDTEDEEQVEAVARLEAELAERNKEAEHLRAEAGETQQLVAGLKDTLRVHKEAAERVQEQNSVLQFQLAGQQQLAAELGRELTACKSRLDAELKQNMEKLQDEVGEVARLESQLAQQRAELAKKDAEAAEMRDLLQEAGEEFLAKEEEITKMATCLREQEAEITQYQLRMSDLKVQLEESHALLAAACNQKEEQDARIDELEEMLEAVQQERDQLSNEVLSLTETLKIGTERGKTAERYLEDMKEGVQESKFLVEKEKATLADMEKKLNDCQLEKQELLASRARLLEELAEVKKSRLNSSSGIELNILIDELKSDLARAEKEKEELTASYNRLRNDSEAAKSRLLALEATKEIMATSSIKDVDESLFGDDEEEEVKKQGTVAELRLELAVIQAERDRLATELERVQAELQRIRSSCDNRSILETEDFEQEEAKAREEEMKEQLDGARKREEQLREQLEEAGKREEQLKEQLQSAANKDQDALNSGNLAAEELQVKLDTCRQDLEASTSKLALVSLELAAVNSELQAARSRLQEEEQSRLEQEAEMKELQIKLKNQDEQQEATEEVMEDLVNRHAEEIESLQAEIATRAKQLTSIEADMTTITAELAVKVDKVTALDSEAAKQTDAIASLTAEIEAHKEDIARLQAEMSTLHDELKTARDELIRAKSENETCQSELESACSERDRAQTELTGAECDLVAARDELESLRSEREKTLSELESARGDLLATRRELELRIAALTDKLNEKNEERVANKSLIVEVEGRADSLEKELVTKDTYIRELEDIIVEKEFRISELEKELKEQQLKNPAVEDKVDGKAAASVEAAAVTVEAVAVMSAAVEEVAVVDTTEAVEEVAAVAASRRQLRRLQEEKERLETQLNDELEAVRQSNQKLRQQLVHKEEQLRSQQLPVTTADEMEQLRSQLAKAAEETKQLASQLVQIREVEEKLRFQLGEVEGQLTAARASAAAAADARVQETADEAEWKERMRLQREDLEQRVAEVEKASSLLAEKEEEARVLQDAAVRAAADRALLEAELGRLKDSLQEAQNEVKQLKKATKEAALTAQQLAETRAKSQDQEKDIVRLKMLEEAMKREENALGLLREELQAKAAENKALQEKIEYLKQNEEAKDYEVKKTKQERDNLVAHYEGIFKKKQQELNSERLKNTDNMKLHEAIARATPTKNPEIKELTSRLHKAEEETVELRREVALLQKKLDEKAAAHEREINRIRRANQLVVKEFKETNQRLQKQVEGSGSLNSSLGTASNSLVSIQVTEASTLEADDDKSDTSLVENTPIAKRTGRGRGGSRGSRTSNRSTLRQSSSLASFEDSNTENEPEGQNRSKVGRKPRVGTGRGKGRKEVSFMEVYGAEPRAESRKRPLKEKQLSPVNQKERLPSYREEEREQVEAEEEDDEERVAVNGVLDFTTPGLSSKKKRKLFTNTPQASQMFTPPTDTESMESPHSVVKRQLRARSARSKK